MALIDNLVAYWKLDESSGNAADSVGSRTLTNQNTVTYTAGKINNAATLAATSSQYFTFTRFDPGSSDFSFSFWFKFTGTIPASGIYPCIISQWDENSSDREWAVAIVGSVMYFYISDNGAGSGITNIAATTTIIPDTWYHCVCTKISTTGKIYINASNEGTNASFKSSVYASAAAPRVGSSVRFGNISNNYWTGQIDEMGIWTRGLSSTEVTTLYNGGNGLQYPFTVAPTGSGFFLLSNYV